MKDLKGKRTETISLSALLGYGSGDFAVQLVINAIIFYLFYYYTDVFLIPASEAGLVILISRLMQGTMNPALGIIVDRTNTRFGSKRPFLLFGAVPLGLLFFIIFLPAGIINNYKFLYALISCMLFFIVFSAVSIPYNSLTAQLTYDSHERSRITAYKMVFGMAGILVAAGLMKPIVSLFENEENGFFFTSLIFGTLAIIVLFITFFSVKENKLPKTDQKHGSFFQEINLIRKNVPFMVLAVMSLFCFMSSNILAIMVNYYFKYVLKAASFIPFALFSIFGVSALVVPIYMYISKRKGKKFAFTLGLSILLITLLTSFILDSTNIAANMILLIISGLGISSIILFPMAMVPDTVEYMEWKTGYRREGLLYGFFVIFFNLSSAIGSLIVGLGLDFAGYVPNVVDQSPESIFSIRFLLTVVPAILIIITIVLLKFYSIDEAFHKKIVLEIIEREKNNISQ